jgi:P-type conjugative transfer protein TrbG
MRYLVVLGVIGLSAWTMPKEAPRMVLPDTPEIPVVQAAPACEPPPPIIKEVSVPVPMPGQPKEIEATLPVCTQGVSKSCKQQVAAIKEANAAARQGPQSRRWINAVQVYNYMPGALYQVYAALTSVTTILLQPGEMVTNYAAGDTERWLVDQAKTGSPEGERWVLLVKPKWPGIHTNLTITTDRRLYLIELHSNEKTYMAAVSWEYGGDAGLHVIRNERPEQVPISPAVAIPMQTLPEKLNFNYAIQGKAHPRWTPVRAFDDGSKTYIQFPAALATTEAPALFLRSAEGNLSLVNYRVRGTFYIIDRLADHIELRVGEKHPAIVKITRQDQEDL